MAFKTMLAGKAEPNKLRFPLLVSPKLDGVRCHIIDGVAVSRNLLPFRNPRIQELFGHRKYDGLDGEFMVGDPTHPEAFRQTGLLNSYGGDVSEVRLHVFDDFTLPSLPFETRLVTAHHRARNTALFSQVLHYPAENDDELVELEQSFLDLGYEGAMIRDPAGPYKFGRATAREGWLLKLKRFEDSEAVIVGYEERMHNANEKTLVRNGKAVRNGRAEGKVATGALGALVVYDVKTQVEFNIGSGFTEAERIALWADRDNLNKRIVKYQFFPTGSKDKPRFPTFKGFRDPGDM